jgi:hypothetical protein
MIGVDNMWIGRFASTNSFIYSENVHILKRQCEERMLDKSTWRTVVCVCVCACFVRVRVCMYVCVFATNRMLYLDRHYTW